MNKIATYVVSVTLAYFLLNVSTIGFNAAEAAGCQTLSSSSLQQRASTYHATIRKASDKYGVSPSLVKAVITVESCFQRKARGSLGEKGLMQLMPATARRFKVENGYNAWQNIHGGTRYLSYLLKRYDGNVQRAVAAYNAGEGRIKRSGRIPNRSYVNKVMKAYGKFSGGKSKAFVASKAYKPSRETAKAATGKAVYKTTAEPAVGSKQNKALPWQDLRNAASTYRVKQGDTVYEVMRQTGVPVKTLIRINGLSAPDKIRAGQVLRLK